MTNLVETAKKIAPQLAATAGEDNALRRLSDRTWKILMDNVASCDQYSQRDGVAAKHR